MSHAKKYSIGLFLVLACALLIILLSSSHLGSALALENPSSYGYGYSAILYDNTNGLPTSDTNALAQTPDGFLWIGSYSGLIRYDGNEFYRYDSSSGISGVVSLYTDSKDRLWIGTNDSGVFVLEKNAFRSYDDEDGLRSLSVRSIAEDDAGNILIATTMGIAYVDTQGVMHVLDDPQINREYVCELVKGSAVIYGITDNGAFFTIKDLSVKSFYAGLPIGGAVRTIYPDPENAEYLYFGTEAASVVYGTLSDGLDTAVEWSVAPRSNARCLKRIDENLWVCSDDGIGYLQNGVYVPLDDLPMNNSVEKVYTDFEGNLWFTSSRQGLMKIVRNRFDLFFSLSNRVVNTVRKQNGLFYIGTDDGLIILNEEKESVHNALTDLLGEVRIRSVTEDSSRKLWFGTGSLGIVSYDPATEVIRTYGTAEGLAHRHARVAKEMSDGRVAVATKGGMCIIEDGAVSAVYDNDDGVNNLEILCVEEGPDGSVYAGSDGDGIYVIGKGLVGRIGRGNGLSSEVIMRIKKDPIDPSLYWIVTGNSIAYMRNGEATTVTGFPYANNFDLYFDASGRIWVLSGNGIYVVKRSAMLENKTIDYIFYDTSDGLPSAATANSYSYLDEDGTLYIASSKIGATNINDAYSYENTVRLALPYVFADDVYLPVTDGKVTVPADCKKLVVCAYAFTYSLNNPHLSYRLEGFDEEATTLLRRQMRPVTYTNLHGGEYKFTLSVIDTMTGEASDSLTVTILKEKNISEQAWFWAIVALLGAGVVIAVAILFFRIKTKKLIERQRRDNELIDEMTGAFANCIDMKDPYTNGHSHRVAKITAAIAKRMGADDETLERYYRIALLHDIGKIAIPDNILNKPGRLTDEEYAVMKSHSQRGYDILRDVKIAPELAIGAGYHHERVDGRGYPNGLQAADIPYVAQIIAVADTFDAMYSNRPYRDGLSLDAISEELKRLSGTQLNAEIVTVLLSMIEEGIFHTEDRNGRDPFCR